MLRTTLVVAALLIFSSAPLAAKHKHHRNSGNFFVQFSIGGGHKHRPQRFRGRQYSQPYFRRGFYDDGYYDSRRRFHKHKRNKRYKHRHRGHRNYCPYH